ncbi:MAG TPA: tripartite tricarboxylate transporter substrate binding protein, partial [Burkholderiales bacterium]
EVVARLHQLTAASLAKPEVAARFATLGTDVAPMNPGELGAFIRSEIAKWAKMTKEAGIEPQ